MFKPNIEDVAPKPIDSPRHVVIRSLMDEAEQKNLVQEVMKRPLRSRSSSLAHDEAWDQLVSSDVSLKFDLGICCGGVLNDVLPQAVSVGRRALQMSTLNLPSYESLHTLAYSTIQFTGLALLYGPKGRMLPHYDSPTQPGQREEWLVMLTFGNPVTFRCNSELVQLYSGDALIMDAMAVLHGVEEVMSGHLEMAWQKVGLPSPSRLGILFWQAGDTTYSEREKLERADDLEGVHNLFEADGD